MLFCAGAAYKMEGVNVDLIARGNRIYRMTINAGPRSTRITRTEFRDSWNILPLALDKLPQTLSLCDENGPIKPKGKDWM